MNVGVLVEQSTFASKLNKYIQQRGNGTYANDAELSLGFLIWLDKNRYKL